MKINFPKIVKGFDLGEYAKEMQGQVVRVWVNPPSGDVVAIADYYKATVEKKELPKTLKLVVKHLAELEKPTKKEKEEHENAIKFYQERIEELAGEKYADSNEKYLEYLSSFLSQSENRETHYSVDDLKELEKASKETDPAFWPWFQQRVIDAISEHRLGRKKA